MHRPWSTVAVGRWGLCSSTHVIFTPLHVWAGIYRPPGCSACATLKTAGATLLFNHLPSRGEGLQVPFASAHSPFPLPTAAAHTHTHSATKKNCRRLRLYRGINGVNPAIHHAVLLPESGPLARRCSSAQSPLRVCLGAITQIIQRDGLAVAGPTPGPLWSPSFVSSASKFPCMFEQNDFCHASKGRLPVVARPYCLPGSLEKLG